MAKTKEVCGEEDPGFTLWTSAHGFHHYTLSNRKGWRLTWAFILFVLVVALAACIAYYFYYVFSTAVYSRFILESPDQRSWPTTIICEKQAFKPSKISQIPALTTAHASLLSWSLSPYLARPGVYASNSRVPTLISEIDQILLRAEYGNQINKLVNAMVPNCTEFILECTVGSTTYNGQDCCGNFVDATPILTRYGTCFTTKTALIQHSLIIAGEGSGFQVVTMHETSSAFDSTLASAEIYGSTGAAFAVVDGTATVDSSLRGQGQSVQPGKIVSVGVSRTRTDNSRLEFSAIGRMKCHPPGVRDTSEVDGDLIFGLDAPYGYTKDNCAAQVKRELLARELLQCSFNPSASNGIKRCSPAQSASYYRSFIDTNNTALNGVNVFKVSDKAGLQERYSKTCIQDCLQDRYAMASSYADLPDSLKGTLEAKLRAAGVTADTVVVLKFFLNSMEYTKIQNFPQHGLQFVAEVGGLMAFFLGLSIVSILECLCYCCICSVRRCSGDDDDEEERQKWKEQMNHNEIHPEDREEARQRAANRQQQFNEMEARLKQMDMSQFEANRR